MKKDMTAELVCFNQSVLTEGPCWDAEKELVYFVNIRLGRVHAWSASRGTCHGWHIGRTVGAVALRAGGGLVMACGDGFFFLDPETGCIEAVADPDPRPFIRFNDGKCDPSGRFLAGTMDDVDRSTGAGALYALEPDHTTRMVIPSLTLPNGLCFAPDGCTFYHIDTPARTVTAYDYDTDTGAAINPRVLITLPKDGGAPDGMTIDEEGLLWIAEWGGGCVGRWDPATGAKVDEIRVPAERVTCAAFGGEHMDELYITTARAGLSAAALRQQPMAGGLFRARPGVRGIPPYRYEG